jgi:hypothetical protein
MRDGFISCGAALGRDAEGERRCADRGGAAGEGVMARAVPPPTALYSARVRRSGVRHERFNLLPEERRWYAGSSAL